MRLTLNLTHSCNLACTYCFAGEARQQEMPFDTGREALELAILQAASCGDDCLEVSFMGGEPLLTMDLLSELASHARLAGDAAGVAVRFQVTTNGTLLDDDRLERLAAIDASVALSVDGLPKFHDRVRRTRGGAPTGEAVWRALDRALERLRDVSVVSVVTPESVDGIADSIRTLTGRGIRRIALNPDWTSTWQDSDLERWRQAYLDTADVYLRAYRDGFPFALNQFDEKIDLRIRGPESATFGCGSNPGDLAIAPSGRVYGCGRAVGEDRSGERSLGGLNVLSDHSNPGDAITDSTTPEECLSCVHRFRCASRCACSNRESSGDPGRPGEIICWHEQMVIPIADSVAATLFAEGNRDFLLRFYGLEPEVSHAAETCHSI